MCYLMADPYILCMNMVENTTNMEVQFGTLAVITPF